MRVQFDIEAVRQLPQLHRATIPPEYLDLMGHMNIQYYIHLFDRAAWGLFQFLDLGEDYYQEQQAGVFALTQFIRYLYEVHAGDTVAVHTRLIAYNPKRVHFVHLMINETRENVASTIEVVATHADLVTRRSAPFPAQALARLEAIVTEHQALAWDSHLSGAMGV